MVEAAMAEQAAVEERKQDLKDLRTKKRRARRRRKSHMVVEGGIRDYDPKQGSDCSPVDRFGTFLLRRGSGGGRPREADAESAGGGGATSEAEGRLGSDLRVRSQE